MKIFISTDMEGIAEVTSKTEIKPGNKPYKKFTAIQSNELVKMCQILGSETQVTIRDAHSEGTNVIPEKLPPNANLIQYFNGDILNMLSGLDKSYYFVILHGYHALGGSEVNPLSHTFSTKKIHSYRLNGKLIGETGWAIYKAAFVGVPVCYITGDNEAVAEAQEINKSIIGTETKRFTENPAVILSKKEVLKKISTDLPLAIKEFKDCKENFKVKLPTEFEVRIRYNHTEDANKYSNFPGVEKIDDYEIKYNAKDFEDLLKMLIVCR